MDTFLRQLTEGYFDFAGKTSRKDFWIYMLSLMVINAVCFAVLGLIYASDEAVTVHEIVNYGDIGQAIHWIARAGGLFMSAVLIFSVWYLYLVIPTLAITVRRLHDTGRSGWWIVAYVVSLLAFSGGILPNLFSALATVLSLSILIFCSMSGQENESTLLSDNQ